MTTRLYRPADPADDEYMTDADLADEMVLFIGRSRRYIVSLRRQGAISCRDAWPLWVVSDEKLSEALSIQQTRVRKIRAALRKAGRLTPALVVFHDVHQQVDQVENARTVLPSCDCMGLRPAKPQVRDLRPGETNESQAA